MVVKVIRAEYDGLREVAQVFAHHADLSVALTFQIEALVDQLQGGAWRGVGADGFYAEMCEVILPAMRKLQDALQFARDSTLTIIEIMQAAEDEAAALFRGLPDGEASHPQQDDEERRRHLIQMLLGTLKFSGLLNSPLPGNLETLTVTELEALLDSYDHAERSYVALKKLVLWALSDQQISILEDAFWELDSGQRYELLTALAWLMEKLAQGEIPNTALLDNLSDAVRTLAATALLNITQRLQQAQNSEGIALDIRVKHLASQYEGAVFADWLGNITAFLSIGSVALFARSGNNTPTDRVKEHLTLQDLEAARRELQGQVVARRSDGKPFDHVTEVREAQRSLVDRITQIKNRLGDSSLSSQRTLSETERYMLESELKEASKLLDFSEKFVPR